ncbi:MAG: hypothetical protein WB424_13715 [Terracidiphilus sp.]
MKPGAVQLQRKRLYRSAALPAIKMPVKKFFENKISESASASRKSQVGEFAAVLGIAIEPSESYCAKGCYQDYGRCAGLNAEPARIDGTGPFPAISVSIWSGFKKELRAIDRSWRQHFRASASAGEPPHFATQGLRARQIPALGCYHSVCPKRLRHCAMRASSF